MPSSKVLKRLRACLPSGCLITDDHAVRPFETDGLTAIRERPWAVALPESVPQVRAVLRVCREEGVPVVTRGAGTGLSGGARPLRHGVLLVLSKLSRIKEVDLDAGTATVEPGVTNLAISEAVRAHGLYYAPDPSSQIACSIGGNVAENAGGVHCLKYGLTVHNVLGLRVQTIEGIELTLGGKGLEQPGFDLLAVMTGSEGMLGVVTEVTVKLLPLPVAKRVLLAAFDALAPAARAVGAIIGAGVGDVLRAHGGEVRVAASEAERERLWKGRKSAFPAMGRLAPDYYCMDGTIPRAALGQVLGDIARLARERDLQVANVFHAGDGNLHPLILFDANAPGEAERAHALGVDILRLCVYAGGTVTGEHGVGVEKLDPMCEQFTAAELAQFHRLKAAFDPTGLLNPGKAVPTLARCSELGGMHVRDGRLPHPHLERF